MNFKMVSSHSVPAMTAFIHADNNLKINGGTINITKSYEGIEASKIYFNDGDITIKAIDDGVNAGAAVIQPILTANLALILLMGDLSEAIRLMTAKQSILKAEH